MNKNQIGIIHISRKNLYESPEKVFEIFMKARILPVDITYHFNNDTVIYALSDFFEEVALGVALPEYDLQISKNEWGDIKDVKAIKKIGAKKKLRLFVWTDFSRDYTSGLAFAIAEDETEAKKLIKKNRGYEVYDWGSLKIYPLTRRIAKSVAGGG